MGIGQWAMQVCPSLRGLIRQRAKGRLGNGRAAIGRGWQQAKEQGQEKENAGQGKGQEVEVKGQEQEAQQTVGRGQRVVMRARRQGVGRVTVKGVGGDTRRRRQGGRSRGRRQGGRSRGRRHGGRSRGRRQGLCCAWKGLAGHVYGGPSGLPDLLDLAALLADDRPTLGGGHQQVQMEVQVVVNTVPVPGSGGSKY